eukprot:scaffold32217_cov27-Tisochrysis_lutea.AAC.2
MPADERKACIFCAWRACTRARCCKRFHRLRIACTNASKEHHVRHKAEGHQQPMPRRYSRGRMHLVCPGRQARRNGAPPWSQITDCAHDDLVLLGRP